MKQKAKEWIVRYLPMEILGTLSAIVVATFVHERTGNLAAAVGAASIAETIGYYSYAVFREVRDQLRATSQHEGFRKALMVLGRSILGLATEFGPAELVDTFLLRPALMYAGASVTDNFIVGVLAGKIVADLIFYAVVLPSYELRKRILPSGEDQVA